MWCFELKHLVSRLRNVQNNCILAWLVFLKKLHHGIFTLQTSCWIATALTLCGLLEMQFYFLGRICVCGIFVFVFVIFLYLCLWYFCIFVNFLQNCDWPASGNAMFCPLCTLQKCFPKVYQCVQWTMNNGEFVYNVQFNVLTEHGLAECKLPPN